MTDRNFKEREREKKKPKFCLFQRYFYIKTHVDNRERAREEKHENFIAAVRKWEMLAAR